MKSTRKEVNLAALAMGTLLGLEFLWFSFNLSMCLIVDKADPKWQDLSERCVSSAAIFVLSAGAVAVLSVLWPDLTDEKP